MAFLLRLRKISRLSNRFPSHHRLLPTSYFVSGSGDRNSNRPSPSFVREVREAIKQLDPNSSSSSSPPPSNSVEQLMANIVRLRDKYAIDRDRVRDMTERRTSFSNEILKEKTMFNAQFVVHMLTLTGNRAQSGTKKTLRRKLNTVIKSFKRLGEMSVQDGEISTALINSRLASLEEIINNFSELKTIHDDEEEEEDLWNETNEVLMRCKKMDLDEAEGLSKQIEEDQDYISWHIEKLSRLCHSMRYRRRR